MSQPTIEADFQNSPLTKDEHTEPTKLQREERMASWVVRNRKRLSYESTFINQAHQLNKIKAPTVMPAEYPHNLAIRLAKRGVIATEKNEKVDDERRDSMSESETGTGDEVKKAEANSFV